MNCEICGMDEGTESGGYVLCPACADRVKAYVDKVAARADRLRRASDRANTAAAADLRRADEMASGIPFGQPILVGHYSEGRDRRYRERIRKTMRRGFEKQKEATELARRAETAENNRAISSDDPAAVLKLTAELAKCKAEQDEMKRVNAIIRKLTRGGKSPTGEILAAEANIPLRRASGLLLPDFAGRIGYPDYKLKNNGANIRRIEQRIAALKKQAAKAAASPVEVEVTESGVKIERNREDNRLRLFFGGKPAPAIIAALKANGFRWSPTIGAWQRQMSPGADYAAATIIKLYNSAS